MRQTARHDRDWAALLIYRPGKAAIYLSKKKTTWTHHTDAANPWHAHTRKHMAIHLSHEVCVNDLQRQTRMTNWWMQINMLIPLRLCSLVKAIDVNLIIKYLFYATLTLLLVWVRACIYKSMNFCIIICNDSYENKTQNTGSLYLLSKHIRFLSEENEQLSDSVLWLWLHWSQ